MQDFLSNLLNDIRVELTEEFDRNFERKAFFNSPWKQTKLTNRKGSMMARNGHLRRSLKAKVVGTSIVFTSSLKYANIHNEGGEITVTEKMKKFFWAMYFKVLGAQAYMKKERNTYNIKKGQIASQEAEIWKALALKKVGSKIKIEQRQFIGWHPSLTPRINKIVSDNMKPFEQQILNVFKRK